MSQKIDFIGFKISILSISILLFTFLISYFLLSILIYTLKTKWNLSVTSYNFSGLKMAKEYSKISNKKIVKISNYKFFHGVSSIYVNEKIAFSNSAWSHAYSLFKVLDTSYYFRLLMVIFQLTGWPLIFFEEYIIYIIGISFILLSWFIGILYSFQSSKIVKRIKENIYPFCNLKDKKILNSIFKYYKFYGLYIAFLVVPHLITDFLKFIKNNGIKDK